MAIKSVFVMGAGAMGNGIAQVAAGAGYAVTMEDISEEIIHKGRSSISNSLDRLVKKGSMNESDKAALLSRISTTTDLNKAKDADLVIEAIPEVLAIKIDAFKRLDAICPKHTIIASNTSSLPISGMGAVTRRPDKVVGIHFMNPVPVMTGVEIICGMHTSSETMQASRDFVKSLGKEPCEARDYGGFIVSRLVDALMNEAIRCVMDGNKAEEVDKAMRLCCNFPIGPLELCDLVGADVVFHGLETLKAEFGDRFHPAPLLQAMVRAGNLGRKVGRGFYGYTKK